jgi:branched-chain amino acid transport system permease protein
MLKFMQYFISGLATGSIYALVTLGLVLIYRSTRILNFAQGDLATAGTYVAFTLLTINLVPIISFPLAILAGSSLAMLFYLVILVPAQRRNASHFGQIILTVGLGLIIQGLISHLWGMDTKSLPFPLSDSKLWRLQGLIISELSLGTFLVGILGSGLLYLLVQKTRLGLAMRATSENLPAAQTLGIPTRMILSLSWGLGAGLSVLAGLFLAPSLLLDPFYMLEPFLKGFAAAILGGLQSLPGAVLGGLILGVAESLVGGYISIAFKNTLAFLIIIVILLVRPEGLLGKEFKERV